MDRILTLSLVAHYQEGAMEIFTSAQQQPICLHPTPLTVTVQCSEVYTCTYIIIIHRCILVYTIIIYSFMQYVRTYYNYYNCFFLMFVSIYNNDIGKNETEFLYRVILRNFIIFLIHVIILASVVNSIKLFVINFQTEMRWSF